MVHTVAVTGASGFVASELIAQLLEKGYTVRGSVRSLSDTAKTSHLTSLPGASERLTLFAADVLDGDAAFSTAFQGCDTVFHTACPFVPMSRAKALGEDYFTAPAVEGTLNVLRAAEAAGTVKRVVMTSSTAAIFKRLVEPGHVYDESTWNDVEELKTREMWYSIGKTKQELAAWEYVRASPRHFDLVCINPTMVAGKMRQPGINASNETVLEYVNGSKSKIPNACMPWVHVLDVAAAHIAAAERPGASGRYMMIAWWGHLADQCASIAKQFPSLVAAGGVPTEVDMPADGVLAVAGRQDSSRVTRELGVTLRGLDECMFDSVTSLIEHGLIKK